MQSRREFITRIAALAGTGVAFSVAHGLGVVEGDDPWIGAPALPRGSGKGCKVVILGAGPAGLSAAYELGLAGYECVILEARNRVGGRVWTVRRDTEVKMTDGSRQVCTFDDGHYLNAGAARIPSHHTATLGYCRELNVPMETEVNFSGSAFVQSDRLNGAKPIALRRAIHDARGHLAELLYKSIKGGGLDTTLSKLDSEKLIAQLTTWGGLSPKGAHALVLGPGSGGQVANLAHVDLAYNGTSASGFATVPGAGDRIGVPVTPLSMETVLDPFVLSMADFHGLIEMQATMQQPVGGMDRIPEALKAQLKPGVLHQGAEVKRIGKKTLPSGNIGVEITYFDKTSAQNKLAAADFCLCTIPLKVLSTIPSDFSEDRKTAIGRAVYGNGTKTAFQAPRFWEREDEIYGGLSFTERDTQITWYPSNGFHGPEGILVAGYAFGSTADKFAARSIADRISYAKATVDRLHPGKSALLKSPLTLEWSKTEYSLGLGCFLDEDDPAAYSLLSQADGPFFFAGEHLSHVGPWQQSALVSAHRSVTMIDARHREGQPVADVRIQ